MCYVIELLFFISCMLLWFTCGRWHFISGLWFVAWLVGQTSWQVDRLLLYFISVISVTVLQWLPSVLWRCWLGNGKGIGPIKSWVLVRRLWRFDWSFARLVVPVVTTTSIILAPVKSRTVAFWCPLARLSWKMAIKRALCCVVCCCDCTLVDSGSHNKRIRQEESLSKGFPQLPDASPPTNLVSVSAGVHGVVVGIRKGIWPKLLLFCSTKSQFTCGHVQASLTR